MTFGGVDLARVPLICDIRYNLMIDEDALPLVLSLLDQIYGLRRELSPVKEALSSLPQSVREAIGRQLVEGTKRSHPRRRRA